MWGVSRSSPSRNADISVRLPARFVVRTLQFVVTEMFGTILVPVDLSEENHASVALASKLAQSEEDVVHLLHVIETIPGLEIEEERDFYERLERNARRYLDKLGKSLDAGKTRWTANIIYGSRAATILAEADRLGADLLVMRSHRLDRDELRDGFGTLSYQVGILARCPVLLVK